MNNWEDAQNAYADAMDSANVATEAQETHMESLEAKTEQFNASMQEFYYDFLDSDLAKGVVDFGTEIVQAFDDILDKVGSVTTAIAGVGLFSMVQSVGKAFSYAAKNGVTFGQGLSSVSSTVGALTKGMTAFNQAYYAGGTGLFQSVGVGISTFVKGLSPLTKVLAVIAAVAGVVTVLNNNLGKSREEIIEAGEEAQSTIDDTLSDYNKRISSVNTDRFATLAQGVNLETNQNMSLTSDEYQEYLSICDAIAESYPQLVAGYDEQGQAILNLGTSAETATAQLEALLAADEAAANFEVASNIQDAFEGAYLQAKDLENEIYLLEGEEKSQLAGLSVSSNGEDSLTGQLAKIVGGEQEILELDRGIDNYREIYDNLYSALDKAGMELGKDYAIGQSIDADYFTFNVDTLNENYDSIINSITAGQQKIANETGESLSETELRLNTLKNEYQGMWDDLVPAFISTLGTNPNYSELTDDIQAGIEDALYNINFADLPSDVLSGDKSLESYLKENFLYPIADAFNDTTGNETAKAAQNAFEKLFSIDTSEISTDDYINEARSYLNDIKEFFKAAYGEEEYEDKYNNFLLTFGFDVEYEVESDNGEEVETKVTNRVMAMRRKLAETMEANGETGNVDLGSISVESLENIYDDVINNGESVVNAYNKEKKAVEEAASKPIELSSLFTTSEGEQSEFSENISAFKSDIDDINSALDDLRNGEEVSIDDLVIDFPELAGSLDDLEGGLESLSIDKLREFSAMWGEATSALEGDQLEAANTLFASIVSSLDLSTYMDNYSQAYSDYESQVEAMADAGGEAAVKMSDDLKQANNDLKSIAEGNIFANFDESDFENQRMVQHVGNIINSLFDEYAGDTAGLEAIIELSANPESAYWTLQEWRDNVEAAKVEIEVDVYQESLDKLEDNLGRIQTQATKIDNEMSRKDIFGIQYSQQDYRDLTNNMNLQLQNLRAQKAVMEEQLATLDPLDSKYAEVASQIQSVESEIISAIGDQQEWNAAAAELNYEAGEALSAYNDATSTRNAGDNYTDMMKAIEDIQSLYEEGLVGTDEFKTGAAMFSAAGMEDAANWVENYETALRYFTEDNSGCINFLNDLSEKTNDAGEALAEFDESTDTWTYNIGNIQDSANQLGISMEEFQAIMGRLQDYGFTNDWFSSVEDGAAHVGDLYADLAQAEMKLQDLEEERANGDEAITDTVLAAQEAEVNGIKNSIVQSEALLDQYIATSAEDFEAKTQAQYSALTSMLDMASEIDASDERVLSSYYQSIQSWADENNIDIAGLFTYDDTGRITGLCDEVYDEIKGIAGENAYVLDYDLTYAKQEVESIGQTLKDAYSDTESGVQEMVDSIVSSYSGKDLMSIVFGDGSYAEGLEDAEYAMDGLIEALGLAQDEGSTLAQILSSYQETRNWDEAIQSVSDSMQVYSSTLDQLQSEGNIGELQNIRFDIGVDDLSLYETENRLDTLTEARQAIVDADLDDTTREAALTQIDGLISECEDHTIELSVETAVGNGENDVRSLMSMYEEGDLEGFAQALGIEVDFEADTSSLDEAYAELQAMDQQEEITATINAVLEESGLSEIDLLGMNEAQLGATFEQELELHPTVSMEDIESQLGYQEVEVPVTIQLEESQFEALASQTEEVDVEVNTDDIAGQIESAVASASPTVDVTVNADEVAGQIQAAAEGVEVTIPVAFETSGTDIDTVSTAAPTPQSTSVQVTASVSGEEEVNSLTGAIEAVNSKYVDVVANVSGTAEVRALIAAINSLTGKVVSVSAIVSGIGEVNSLAASIAAVQSKTVTVTTITQNISSGGDEHGSGALGTAHASGTAYSMWTGYRHSIGAYADGSTQDWALPRNEQAIVNEIGTESIVYFCDFTWRHVLKNLFNCWEPVKPTKLQRKDEICLSANVAKAEKISWMMHGANLNIV